MPFHITNVGAKDMGIVLDNPYGHKINWQEIVNPSRTPTDLLKRYLKDAIIGDGPDGELIWLTVLHQSFDPDKVLKNFSWIKCVPEPIADIIDTQNG